MNASIPGQPDAVPQDADATAENGKQPHATDPQRWSDGTLRRGNAAALKHGAYAAARDQGEVPATLVTTITEFREGVVADLGGPEALTTIQRAYVQRLGDLEIMVRLIQNDLVNRGVTTPKGRVRASFTKLLETFDRWDRFAQRLGTERRAKPVTFAAAVIAAGETREP